MKINPLDNSFLSKLPKMNEISSLNMSSPVDTFIRSTGDSDFNSENTDYYKSAPDSEIASIILYSFGQLPLRPFYPNNFEEFLNVCKLNSLLRQRAVNIFKSHNINSTADVFNAGRIYSNPDVSFIYNEKEEDYLDIYSKLKNKDYLLKFPDLLRVNYTIDSTKENNDEKDDKVNLLDEYFDYLTLVGLDSSKQIEAAFEFLKPDYNDFDTFLDFSGVTNDFLGALSDIIDSVDFVQNENNMNFKDSDIFSFISKNVDVLYYLHRKDPEKFSATLSRVFYLLNNNDKVKSVVEKRLGPDFGGFNTPADKVEFYNFAADANVSIPYINDLNTNMAIYDSSLTEAIANKKDICSELIESYGFDKNNANGIYKKFSDVLNIAYKYDKQNTDATMFDDTIKLIGDKKISNSKSIYKMYCDLAKRPIKNFTSDNFIEFIQLLKFKPKGDINVVAKKNKCTPLIYLQNEKTQFDSVSADIEKFLSTTENPDFIGKSPLEIFYSYKESLLSNPSKVFSTLTTAAMLKTPDSNNFEFKINNINKFSQFFGSREDTLDFIYKNKILLDNSKEDNEYINNCFSIFNRLYSPRNPEESIAFAKKLSDSKFLLHSKEQLGKMLNDFSSSALLENSLQVFLDKKVKNYREFQQYKTLLNADNSSIAKLVMHLASLPDNVSFDDISNYIANLQHELSEISSPVKVNADNIGYLTPDDITSNGMNNSFDFSILNKLLNIPLEINPVLTFRKPFDWKSTNEFSAFQIASEISTRQFGHSEPYKNIIRLLKKDNPSFEFGSDPTDSAYNIYSVIPQKFVELLNNGIKIVSPIDGKERKLNLSCHGFLRLIDRFILDKAESFDEVYSDESLNKMQEYLNCVYSKTPEKLSFNEHNHVVAISKYNGEYVESVFAQDGTMITTVKKRNQNWKESEN